MQWPSRPACFLATGWLDGLPVPLGPVPGSPSPALALMGAIRRVSITAHITIVFFMLRSSANSSRLNLTNATDCQWKFRRLSPCRFDRMEVG
jgi:hypothetical protein